MFKKSGVGVFLLFLILAASLQAQVNVLYSFANNGSPYDGPILKGGWLYGTTRWGGTSSYGTIYRIRTTGTGFMVLHNFLGGTDGRIAYGALVSGGSTSPWLYGMTEYGGADNRGVIYRIRTDGTGYQVLHPFAGGVSDGGDPCAALTRVGSVLYGMAPAGGTTNNGVIFKIQANGTGFQVLHSFAGGTTEGSLPMGSLKASGSWLYGTTFGGGAYSSGTVFKVQTNGTGFQTLHSFGSTGTDGTQLEGSLILINSILYGMTLNGGASGRGTIFKIKTDGTGYAVLHSFTGGTADGGGPYGALKAKGSTLYGMTVAGGHGLGTIFKINTNGTQFLVLYSFSGGVSDGSVPFGTLIASLSTFYGVTSKGGASNYGTVFRFKL